MLYFSFLSARFDLDGFKIAQTMAFAINEINQNPNLLPDLSLGYSIYDNCVKLGVAFRAATALISGAQKTLSSSGCSGLPPVLGIVGDSISTHSIAISSVAGLYRVPMVRAGVIQYALKRRLSFGGAGLHVQCSSCEKLL